MSEKIISDVIQLAVGGDRLPRLFEEAVMRAEKMAAEQFGIDDYGHSSKIEEWERSNCSIRVAQKGFVADGDVRGWSYRFIFDVCCVKQVEEEDVEESEGAS